MPHRRCFLNCACHETTRHNPTRTHLHARAECSVRTPQKRRTGRYRVNASYHCSQRRTIQLYGLYERENAREDNGFWNAVCQPRHGEFWNRWHWKDYYAKCDGDEYGKFHRDHRSDGGYWREFHNRRWDTGSVDSPGPEQNDSNPVCAAVGRLRLGRLHSDQRCYEFTIVRRARRDRRATRTGNLSGDS